MTINGSTVEPHKFFANQKWLDSHLQEAPNEIRLFLEGDGITLGGKKVLDIGTGDGLIAKSLSHLGNCDVLGVDILELDDDFLTNATEKLCDSNCKHKFSFSKINKNLGINYDEEFDLAISWSAAEHIIDFQSTCNQVFRSLKKNGLFFLQTYPLWNSAWGHHLFEWLPRYFHLNHTVLEMVQHLSKIVNVPNPIELKNGTCTDDLSLILQDRNLSKTSWLNKCEELLASCNQITIQEIESMLENSGFVISKVELITSTSHLPEIGTKLLDSLIDGVKLLAYKP